MKSVQYAQWVMTTAIEGNKSNCYRCDRSFGLLSTCLGSHRMFGREKDEGNVMAVIKSKVSG